MSYSRILLFHEDRQYYGLGKPGSVWRKPINIHKLPLDLWPQRKQAFIMTIKIYHLRHINMHTALTGGRHEVIEKNRESTKSQPTTEFECSNHEP